MAKYRKLSRTASQRKALLRSQVTALLYHGKIITTEAKAKEVRKIAEGLIAMAVRERDNFETVTVTAKVARKDAEGKRIKELVDGKKKTVYDEVFVNGKNDSGQFFYVNEKKFRYSIYPILLDNLNGQKEHIFSVIYIYNDELFFEELKRIQGHSNFY